METPYFSLKLYIIFEKLDIFKNSRKASSMKLNPIPSINEFTETTTPKTIYFYRRLNFYFVNLSGEPEQNKKLT
jgi:hypothetical protein